MGYSTSNLMRVRIAGLLLFGIVSVASAGDWVELKNCRMAENLSNDADSFVVEAPDAYRGEARNRFRLYFVDAAETDSNSDFKKERLIEQAAYWGSDDPDFALKMGLRASQMVSRLLRGGFSVYTRGEYAPSMGTPRYYAMIRVKNRWLTDILVEEGLVRIYGQGTDLPDGSDEQQHWRTLRQLEREARAKRVNGWQRAAEIADPVEEAFASLDVVLKDSTWVYSIQDGREVTALAKGTLVTVVSPAENSRVRIRFKKNGKVYEGCCEQRSLRP